MASPKYRRILLKLSGEALMGDQGFGIDPDTIREVALKIKNALEMGVEIAIVVGGGNIFRGMASSARGMNRASADYMGMLATMQNAIALADGLETAGIPARVLSAIDMRPVAETYNRPRALQHLAAGRVVIFGAGTGNPYFTTDTAAALRALEIEADVIMKATKVDGIYTADPMKDPDAKLIPETDYMTVLEKQLKVMDATAISLCMDNRMPILVFELMKAGNIVNAVMGQSIGTLVEDKSC